MNKIKTWVGFKRYFEEFGHYDYDRIECESVSHGFVIYNFLKQEGYEDVSLWAYDEKCFGYRIA